MSVDVTRTLQYSVMSIYDIQEVEDHHLVFNKEGREKEKGNALSYIV